MKIAVVALTALLAFGLSVASSIAADKKSDSKKAESKPAAAAAAESEKPAKKAKPVKLTKPWSAISSLTEEQKAKINEIHKNALEEINQVKAREKDAIMATLTEEQRAEATTMIEKDTAAKKMKDDVEKAGS